MRRSLLQTDWMDIGTLKENIQKLKVREISFRPKKKRMIKNPNLKISKKIARHPFRMSSKTKKTVTLN